MSKSKRFISLAEFNPDFVFEWHPTLNGDLTPQKISYGSSIKVWWICNKGHIWYQSPNNRTRGRGCPDCGKALRSNTRLKNRILKDGSLAERNPDLSRQWNFLKNDGLTPYDVSLGSGKKVWWICDKGHEWEATINSRNQDSNCPICSGHKILVGYNDLATVNPKLAKQWHPTKNGLLLPTDVTAGTNKKVWWIGECGHEWDASINHRIDGTDCPVCRGKKVIEGVNDLASLHSELALEWHPTKNKKIMPTQVTSNSNKKVWWKCSRGHEWETSVCTRTRGRGCPICAAESKTSFPEQAIFFYFNRMTEAYNRYMVNGLTEIDVYLPKYKIGIEYDGLYYHKTEKAKTREKKKEEILKKLGIFLFRVKEINDKKLVDFTDSAVYLSSQNKDDELSAVISELVDKVNQFANISLQTEIDVSKDRSEIYSQYIVSEKQRSLLYLKPDVASQWHPTKNGDLLPQNVFANANRKVWWVCEKGHEWQSSINSRSPNSGCPYCSGKKVLVGWNDLATTNPSLALQWHPTKNGNKSPNTYTAGSNKKVWWICDKGHEWEATVCDRSSGKGCAVCSGHKVLKGYNDLETTHPILALQWHPIKNGNTKATEVTHGSDKKAWWLGECGHEWEAPICSRSQGSKCPYCSNQMVLIGYNDLATINPDLALQWHPTKNGNKRPTDYTAGSNKKAWWIGECGHEWDANIASRNSGRGCPYCSNQKLLVGFNDLSTKNPQLALQWHPTKNGSKHPTDYTSGSNKKVWWMCEKGHEWKIEIKIRNDGNGCPYCSNQMVLVGYNDLATTNSDLALQWHPTKNRSKRPTDYTAGSNKKAWWLCDKGHEWEATIASRNKGAGCKECYHLRRRKK